MGRRKGSLLIEALVAITVATTVAFALLRWVPVQVLALRACQDRSDALSVSDEFFSAIKSQSFASLTPGPLTLQPVVRNGTSYRLQGQVVPAADYRATQILDIDLVVEWQTGSITKQLHRVQCLVNPKASN